MNKTSTKQLTSIDSAEDTQQSGYRLVQRTQYKDKTGPDLVGGGDSLTSLK